MEFTSWNPNELAHHGTRGMKWGERRYQNRDGSLTPLGKERYGVNGERSARSTKRDLNKLDRERAHAALQYSINKKKYDKKTKKINKKIGRISKENNENSQEKIASLREKQKKLNSTVGKKVEDYKKLLDRNKRLSERIINKSLKKGYSVQSRSVMRYVPTGKSVATQVLALGFGALGSSVAAATVNVVSGRKYKVRDDGLGIRTHKERISRINRLNHS